MNWFEEQIRSRQQSDREALNEAYEVAINSIIGESFRFEDAEDELTLIIRYYGLPLVKVPEEIVDDAERLSAFCRLSGLMTRQVELTKGWYKNAIGAYLCHFKEGGEAVAVIPGRFGGYSYYDKKQHKKIHLNRKTEKLLADEAICFYKPLPVKPLSILDLVKFGISSWSAGDYLFTILLMAIATLIGLLVPKVSHFLYSEVVTFKSVNLLISTMIFLISLNISTTLLTAMQTLFSSRSSTKLSAAIQSANMMRTLSLPAAFFRQFSSGEIMSRMGYLENICTTIVSIFFNTTLSSLFSLAYITQIFNYAPSLVIPSLCVIAANLLFSLYTTFKQMKISRRIMELGAKNNGLGIEMISGIQKIKMSGSEKRMFARYTKKFAEESKVTYNPPFFIKYNTVLATAISLIGTLVLYYVAVKSSISMADYYAFQTSYGMISAALTSLIGIAIQVAAMKPSLEMVKPILEALPENMEKAEDVVSLSGAIEMSHVCFRYDEAASNVIDDFSLRIQPGQYVAIVGKTGCGKSTLIRLLLGFEKPQKGSIYYDSKDINLLEKRSLRQKIGTVMQDDKLFSGDIFSNIVICSPLLPMSRAWEAAEIAGIADDIREMPMGMHTLISEGSGGISGGQRQRLAIARAVAPKPKILIMDEATSALDNITQKKVSEALDTLKCTRIVIAHRLSTIKHCDRILVMDQGHIIEDGSYDELIQNDGYFTELVERQRLDINNDKRCRDQSH